MAERAVYQRAPISVASDCRVECPLLTEAAHETPEKRPLILNWVAERCWIAAGHNGRCRARSGKHGIPSRFAKASGRQFRPNGAPEAQFVGQGVDPDDAAVFKCLDDHLLQFGLGASCRAVAALIQVHHLVPFGGGQADGTTTGLGCVLHPRL